MSRCHTLGSSPIISTFIANNLSPMMNLAEQLRDWADRTADFYHDIATSDSDCDLSFYTQSDLSRVRQPPELLIWPSTPDMVVPIETNWRTRIGASKEVCMGIG